jgi:hypothetical protein
MLEKVFWFGVGYLVARYIIMNTPDYKTKEAQQIDDLRNAVHDLVKKFAPEADDQAIAADVVTTVK